MAWMVEILDAALPEFDVVVADPARDLLNAAPRQRERLVVHVDADDAAGGADDLARDEADLSRARAQIEHGLPCAKVPAGIAAAMVAFDHFVGNGGEKPPVVARWAAEARLASPGRLRVSGLDCCFDVGDCAGDRGPSCSFAEVFCSNLPGAGPGVTWAATSFLSASCAGPPCRADRRSVAEVIAMLIVRAPDPRSSCGSATLRDMQGLDSVEACNALEISESNQNIGKSRKKGERK